MTARAYIEQNLTMFCLLNIETICQCQVFFPEGTH
jgi:hypothetical protein